MKELSLFKLSIAMYIEMSLRLLTVVINTYMISRVNVHLIGALGAGNQIFMLFITIFSFLGVGCSVLVSQAIGAKNKSLALKAIHMSIAFNAVLGLFCGIFVFIFSDLLLKILQVPNELLYESSVYLRVLSVVFTIDAIAIVISAIIRVYGYANHIMFVAIFMNIITIIGNYIALFEPFGMPYLGLFGIGLSTIFGRICGIILFFIIAVKIVRVRFYLVLFLNFNKNILRKILSVGLPSAGENLLWTVQYMIAFGFVASMGKSSLTAQTIYFQISAFIFFAASAISMANEVIVGRLVGAGESEKAYNQTFKTLKIALAITALFIFLVFISKEKIMQILNFTPELANTMRPLFYLTIVLEIGRSFNIIFVNALRASGDARFPFYMGLIFMIGVSIPLGYFLGIHLGIGILGVWIGFCADEWLRGIAHTWRWKSKRWISKKLV